MVSLLKLLLIKGVKSSRKKKFVFGQIFKGSGGYTTRIRRLFNKDREVMFSDAIIEPVKSLRKKVFFSANFALLAGFFGIGATIRINQEMLCVPYAGFFLLNLLSKH